MRIGVLGGSFDPIHNGHLIVARLAIEQLRLDRVLFTVAGAQPLKRGRHAASASERLDMVELGVAGIPDFSADGRELRRATPSYTIDTLRELKAEWPDTELVLLMGADVARTFGEWRDPEGVRALATLAVCHRAAGWAVGADSAGAEAPALALEVRVPTIDISSTAVRARAAAGRSLIGWVPPAVADYIVASQLYRSRRG